MRAINLPSGFSYKTWWVRLWGVVAVGLIAGIFVMPYRWWFVATFLLFGAMEGIGIWGGNPELPPLTDVTAEYVPYWFAIPAIWAFWGGAFVTWHAYRGPLSMALMAGLLGWLNAHFTDKYKI